MAIDNTKRERGRQAEREREVVKECPFSVAPQSGGIFNMTGGGRERERGEHTMMECENEKGRKGKDSRLERNRWREEREVE